MTDKLLPDNLAVAAPKGAFFGMLQGRLGHDPEIRETKNGKKVTTVSVAIDGFRREDPPIWARVTMWDKTAEIAAEYMKKGSWGQFMNLSLKDGTYEDGEGNKKGGLEFTAGRLVLGPRVVEKHGGTAPSRGSEGPSGDDDMPF